MSAKRHTLVVQSTAIQSTTGVMGGALRVSTMKLSVVLAQLASGESVDRIAWFWGADVNELRRAIRALKKAVDKMEA